MPPCSSARSIIERVPTPTTASSAIPVPASRQRISRSVSSTSTSSTHRSVPLCRAALVTASLAIPYAAAASPSGSPARAVATAGGQTSSTVMPVARCRSTSSTRAAYRPSSDSTGGSRLREADRTSSMRRVSSDCSSVSIARGGGGVAGERVLHPLQTQSQSGQPGHQTVVQLAADHLAFPEARGGQPIPGRLQIGRAVGERERGGDHLEELLQSGATPAVQHLPGRHGDGQASDRTTSVAQRELLGLRRRRCPTGPAPGRRHRPGSPTPAAACVRGSR